jgi:hypothetical protein
MTMLLNCRFSAQALPALIWVELTGPRAGLGRLKAVRGASTALSRLSQLGYV